MTKIGMLLNFNLNRDQFIAYYISGLLSFQDCGVDFVHEVLILGCVLN